MTNQNNERARLAIEKCRAIMRKIARLTSEEEPSTDGADALAEASEQLAALFVEYPDVFPDPPVSVEKLRAHARELKTSNAVVRRADTDAADVARELDDANRSLDGALNEIARPPRNEKPS
jgi:hypothetical protein